MLIDATSILYWGPFPPTGIQRLEAELLRQALQQTDPKIGFFVFDRRSSTCRSLRAHENDFLRFCVFNELSRDSEERTPVSRFLEVIRIYSRNSIFFGKESARAAALYIAQRTDRKGFVYGFLKVLLRLCLGTLSLLHTMKFIVSARPPDILTQGAQACLMSFQTMMKARKAYLQKNITAQLYCLFYDTIPLEYPEYVGRAYREKFEHTFKTFISLAKGVVSISHASQEMAIRWSEKFGIHSESRRFLPLQLTSALARSEVAPLRPAHVPATDYVLYCSTIEPRKNHKVLITAWSRMHRSLGDRTPVLLIVGRLGWMYDELLEAVRESGLSKFIVFRGSVSDAELKWFYANARFCVFPSFKEGWGLGVTESLDFGIPVVVSTDPALLEASQCLMPAVDPHQPDAWANEIMKLSTDQQELDRLKARISGQYKTNDIRSTFASIENFISEEA